MELIRNSARASMPVAERWEPKRAKIELSIVPNHPLAHGPAFMCVDHGRGLTDPDFDRYFNWIGTPLAKLRADQRGNNLGDSQKGQGRFAALGINSQCTDEDIMVRIKGGYFILSRTAKTGPVRFVSFVPEKAETEGIELDRFIDPSSTELGPLKSIQGSFTAIIVPNPIFKTNAAIYDAIKWFLPRERDKMFDLSIGGQLVQPPPLESAVTVTSEDGRYRARLGVGTKQSDGVWLCDSDTAFRVASCQSMGSRFVPDPLWYPDLVGDIFAPGLLRYQNTARSTLAREYTRAGNREWQRFKMFLMSRVAPAAKALIERDDFNDDAAATLNELAEMFNERFGEPDEHFGVPEPRVHTATPATESGVTTPATENGVATPRNSGGGERTGGASPRQRYLSIKVRDEVYTLYRGQSLHPFVFAQTSSSDPRVIQVNVRGGYKALPETKYGRREHCLMQILTAIGMNKFPLSQQQAIAFANEVRSEFLK
jgi:hypothetical protein